MTDPVQQLIDSGAIPDSPFVPQSRYRSVGLAELPGIGGGPKLRYVRRRFIARDAALAVSMTHVVSANERPDTLAARYFGEPLVWWHIADANKVIDPNELTDTPGALVSVPVLQGS